MPDFIDAFMMFVIMALIIFFALAASIAFVNSPSSSYESQGCSDIRNVSENKTITRTMLMPMGKGVLMPMITHHTVYHHYYVCLNGSQFEGGWY